MQHDTLVYLENWFPYDVTKSCLLIVRYSLIAIETLNLQHIINVIGHIDMWEMEKFKRRNIYF